MSDCEIMVKTVGEKLYSYLERNPSEYDVTFSVGPQKEEVKALKIILKASSSVFEQEFNEKWEKAVLREGTGISLPDLDPKAFRIFIRLLTLDTWSTVVLESLKLPANDLLNLISICRRYKITMAVKNLEELAEEFYSNFDSCISTDSFANMSTANLEAVLSSDKISGNEKDIFEAVYKWADLRCIEKEVEPTPRNIREELGGVLFQIRFPLMTVADFKSKQIKEILTAEERIAIYDYITLTDDEKLNFEDCEFPFETRPRQGIQRDRSETLTLFLAQGLKIIENPPFVCVGTTKHWHSLKPKAKIELHALGFLGPLDADASYDITVKIQTIKNRTVSFRSKEIKQTVFARKGKTFYFTFNVPYTLERTNNQVWGDRYEVLYSIQGPNTKSTDAVVSGNLSRLPFHASGVDFEIMYGSKQLVEILFKKIE